MNKPTPPTEYRMLVEDRDVTTIHDLIWIIDDKSFQNGHSYVTQRWAHSVMQTEDGIRVAADVNQKYKEPKKPEDYCFFRCRKI